MLDRRRPFFAGILMLTVFGAVSVTCGGDAGDGPSRAVESEPQPLVDPDEIVTGGPPPGGIPPTSLVGEIMKEIPRDKEPLPQFKFYI